jgi:ABC-type Fe3+-hydroxamate transport system substrate-binding protein
MVLRKFTDQLGRQIEIPFPPKKIVSVVPSQTELLFDLGLTDEIAAVTKFCIYPKIQMLNKEKVGGTKSLGLEKIVQIAPDLILANKEENTQEEIELLAKKFPVWISDIKNLADSIAMMEAVGEITNTADCASNLSKSIETKFAALKPFKPLRTVYLIWKKPFMAVNSDTFIHDMLGYAGFENATANSGLRYPDLSVDDLKAINPDVLLLSSEPFPFGEQHIAELAEILPSCSIHLVDGELFSWYGSRLLQSPEYFINLRKQINNVL